MVGNTAYFIGDINTGKYRVTGKIKGTDDDVDLWLVIGSYFKYCYPSRSQQRHCDVYTVPFAADMVRLTAGC